jgi:hypothetical protein
MSVFVSCRKRSTARCGVLPMPDEPKLSSPGFARASSMNSSRLVAFTDGCATSSKPLLRFVDALRLCRSLASDLRMCGYIREARRELPWCSLSLSFSLIV